MGTLSDTNTSAAVDQPASSGQNSVANSTHRSDNTAGVTRRSSAAASESRLVEHSSSNSVTQAAVDGDKTPSSSTSHDNQQNTSNTHGAVEAQLSSNNDSKSSPGKRAKPPSTPYVYTAVKDIKSGKLVNVFGVVKYVRPATRGRGIGEKIL